MSGITPLGKGCARNTIAEAIRESEPKLTVPQYYEQPLGLQAKPISMLSPIFSFVGLLAIYYMRKRSTLAGSLAYIIITGLWLSLTLPIAKPEVSSSCNSISIRWSVRRGNGGVRGVSLDNKDYDNSERPAKTDFCDYVQVNVDKSFGPADS